jgi:hypothetical protein
MELKTLQQRIEERAEKRLLRDMLKAADLEREIQYIVGQENYSSRLSVSNYYDSYSNSSGIRLNSDTDKEIFAARLPQYISDVTEEILKKIDEIDYLLKNPQYQEEL